MCQHNAWFNWLNELVFKGKNKSNSMKHVLKNEHKVQGNIVSKVNYGRTPLKQETNEKYKWKKKHV